MKSAIHQQKVFIPQPFSFAVQTDENRVVSADVAIEIEAKKTDHVGAECRLNAAGVQANSILARGCAGIAPFLHDTRAAIAVVTAAEVYAAMGLEIRNGQGIDRCTIDFAVGSDSCRILTRRASRDVLCWRGRGFGAPKADIKCVIAVDVPLEIDPQDVHRFRAQGRHRTCRSSSAAIIALERRSLSPLKRWSIAALARVSRAHADPAMGTKSIEDTGRCRTTTERSTRMIDGKLVRIARSCRLHQGCRVAAESRIEFVVRVDVAVHVQSKELDRGSSQIEGLAGIVKTDPTVAQFG